MSDNLAGLLPGDVVLVRSTGLIGALIRFGERVRYQGWWRALWWLARTSVRVAPPDVPSEPWYVSHAAVAVGGGQLIEALAQGLTSSPVSKYAGATTVVVLLDSVRPLVSDAERASLARFARTQLARHDRYGWLSIASIVIQLLSPLRLDVSWDGALICSAFAAQCWEHTGVVLPTRSSLTTMPADLAAMAGAGGSGAPLAPVIALRRAA